MKLRPLSAVTVLALPVVTACGAPGPHGTTSEERQSPYVAAADAGDMAVRGIRVVPATGDAAGYVLAVVVNSGDHPDALTNATIEGGTIAPVGLTTLDIQPNHSLQFSSPDIDPSLPALQIGTLATPLQVGTTVPMTFTFADAGSVSVQVPVKSAVQVGTTNTSEPIATTGSYGTTG